MHRILAVLALATVGCGPKTYADISGTFNGKSFKPLSYYWGGPYVVFTNEVLDCMEMSWMRRGPTFQNGGEAPVDSDLKALLFTYDAPEVVTGDYSVEGDAPVDARMLDITDGALTVYPSITGSLVIDEVESQKDALGSFEVGFDEGDLSGDFEVEWCNNMKSKD